MELTTRELASVILLAVFLGVLLAIPKMRQGVLPSFSAVVRAFFVPKILAVVFVYLAYTAAGVFVAYRVGVWSVDLLKDTLIITLFVGLPIAMNAHKMRTCKALISEVVRETIGFSVLLAFYLNVEPLPLWGELLVQPIGIFFALMALAGHREESTRRIGNVFNVLTALIAVGLLTYTTIQILQHWRTYDLSQLMGSLALSICLPFYLTPLIHVVTFVVHGETIYRRLPYFNDEKSPKVRVRLALVIGLRFSTQLAFSFNGPWLRHIARATGLRDGLRVMRDFRQSLRDEAEAERRHLTHLHEFADVAGVDANGLTLDRREFAETKSVLTDVFYMQMGWHRNRFGHFRDDTLNILASVTKRGLPAEHGIELRVRKDKQEWMAWRQVPGGWYFGVGGTKDLDDQWQYDGPTLPAGYPSEGHSVWVNATRSPCSPEWTASDKPSIARR